MSALYYHNVIHKTPKYFAVKLSEYDFLANHYTKISLGILVKIPKKKNVVELGHT